MHDSKCLTLTITEAAAMLGISRNLAYSLAKQDRLGVKVIHLGRRMVLSRQSIEILLSGNGASGDKKDEHA